MRLISKLFLFAFAGTAASSAAAQSSGGYEPPPVEYATPDNAAQAPEPRPVVRTAQSGVSYDPPPVEYSAPTQAQGPLLPVVEQVQEPVRPARGGRRRVDVGAFVEVNAGAAAELRDRGNLLGNDDTLTYTSVAAGVEGQVSTHRVAASFGYRYERRIELSGDLPDQDIHSGIAQARVQVAQPLSIEAGGIATRTGGAGRAVGVTDREATAQVVAGYAGPTFSTRAGPVNVNAFYRLGYVNVDDDTLAGATGTGRNFHATTHMAGASVGAAPGPAPIGWGVSVGHVSETASQFDTHFQAQFVRGDVILPVNPALALTAGVGYSRGRATQSDFLRDGTGAPVIDASGNLVADPNRPRVVAYDQSGIFADAGIIYRPSPRSELQLRAGINDDGDPIVAGSALFRVGRNFGFSFTLYDNDETFGSSLQRNLRNLPDNARIDPDPLTGNVTTGCVFSQDEPGRGSCISPALQSITGASFRARGGSVLFSGGRRLWSYGGGISFAQRDFYLPDDPIFANAFAPSDRDLAVFGNLGRRLGRNASLGLGGFLSVYTTEDQTADDVTTLGARASFTRSFLLDRLQLMIALGLTHRALSIAPDSLVADGIIGLRYTF